MSVHAFASFTGSSLPTTFTLLHFLSFTTYSDIEKSNDMFVRGAKQHGGFAAVLHPLPVPALPGRRSLLPVVPPKSGPFPIPRQGCQAHPAGTSRGVPEGEAVSSLAAVTDIADTEHIRKRCIGAFVHVAFYKGKGTHRYIILDEGTVGLRQLAYDLQLSFCFFSRYNYIWDYSTCSGHENVITRDAAPKEENEEVALCPASQTDTFLFVNVCCRLHADGRFACTL